MPPARGCSPGVPAVLPALPKQFPNNRLGLARWLVDPSNPLTSRVTVNRFWQALFGVGLGQDRGRLWVTRRPATAS